MTQAKGIIDILNKKSSGTIAIFDKGDFYKCYGNDAILVANNIFLSEVGLRKTLIDSEEIIYLNINNAQYIKVIKDFLLIYNYRVEVYEEDNGKYFLKAKGTLGNLVDFEEIVSNCVELTEVSTLMSARLLGNDYNKENHISLCFCNSQEMQIFIAEFNDCAHFPLFEQCVISLTPRECLLLTNDQETAPNRFKNLEKALERSNILQTNVNLFTEDFEICKKEVSKILKNSFKDYQLNDGLIQILYTLLKHMEIFDDEKYDNSFTISNYGSIGYMYVSNGTLNALEVFSLSGDQESTNLSTLTGNVFTLYDHLNRCRSQSGRRILRDWMRRPLFDLRRIQERLDVVEALCNQHSIRQSFYDDLLRRIPDIGLLARKLNQKKASLQDCYRLYQLIRLLHRFELEINDLIESSDPKFQSSITELILEPIRHSCAEFSKFVSLLESTLDIDYCEETGNYRIKPEIDENLTEMAEKIKKLDKKAQLILDKINSKLDTDSVRLDTNLEYGYFFKITLKSEKLIRNSHLNLKILDATKGGGIRFMNNALEELNCDFCDLQNAYEAGQLELTKAVITTCGGYVPAMQSLSERLGILDVLTSFSIVASSSSMPYVRPNLLEKGTKVFELIECRHPVIEQAPNMQFIPNSVNLGTSNKENVNSSFIVLTGANMGGKSTYLRSNALAVFMAQMGCFVACSSARFSLIDGIFTRVGAGDYQSKGVSTFMAEMMDCATILETATENSLIIVDELGRGTSTYDGFGLAWAIAEEIIQRIKCFCLFATHFHEMGRLKNVFPNEVENFQVNTIIDENRKLTILYQIIPGVADRSFGLNIAELVGFPPEIVKNAANVLNILGGSKVQKV